VVKLRAFSSKTRIQDVINSYMFYSKIEYESAADFTISYNDKTVNLNDRTSCTLGGLFEKNYITISISVISVCSRLYTQPAAHLRGEEDLENILEFIEGPNMKKSPEKKKTKTKKQSKKQRNENKKFSQDSSSVSPNIESEPSKSVDKPDNPVDDQELKANKLKNKTKEQEKDLTQATNREKQNYEAEPPKESLSCKTTFSSVANKHDSQNLKELGEHSTGSMQSKIIVAAKTQVEEKDEKHKLEVILKGQLDLLDKNKSNLDDMIEIKSKEMKELIVRISTIEDQNIGKDKRMTSIDLEIEDLERGISKLKTEKQLMEKEKDMANSTKQKLSTKKGNLETYIEEEMKNTKERENSIKKKIKTIEEEISVLDNINAKEDKDKTKEIEQIVVNDPNQILLDFLDNSIIDKEKDLECPVCLETASSPIYSCQENHLICSVCRPKVAECPECRMVYRDNEGMRRHRYAEKTATELERLIEQRNKIVGRPC